MSQWLVAQESVSRFNENNFLLNGFEEMRYATLCTFLYLSVLIKQTGIAQTPKDLLYNGNYEEAIQLAGKDKVITVEKLNFIAMSHWYNYSYDSALIFYEKSLSINNDQPKENIISLLGLVDYYLENTKISLAEKYLKEAEKLHADLLDDDLKKRLLFRKAKLAYFTDYEKSTELYEAALQLYSDKDIEKTKVFAFYLDFLLEKSLEKTDSVFVEVEKLRVKNFSRNNVLRSELLLFKGYFLYQKEEIKSAISVFEKELYPLVSAGNSQWNRHLKSEYYRLVHYPYSKIKNGLKVIENHQQYLKIISELYGENYFRYPETYMAIAKEYEMLGNYELSFNYLERAIKLLGKSENSGVLIIALFKKGSLAFVKEDYEQSATIFQKLLKTKIQSNSQLYYKAYANYYLAALDFKNQNYEDAQYKIEGCIGFLEQQMNIPPSDLIDLYSLYFKIFYRSNQYSKASAVKDQILNAIGEAGMEEVVNIQFINDYTQYLIEESKYDSAIHYIDKIISANGDSFNDSENLNKRKLLSRALFLKGTSIAAKATLQQGNELLLESFKSLQDGIRIIEDIRKEYRTAADRLKNYGQLHETFTEGIKVAHLLYQRTGNDFYLEEGFRFAELAKSHQLLESLNRNRAIKQSQIPDTMLLRINNLKTQTSYIHTEIKRLEGLSSIETGDSLKLEGYRLLLIENQADFSGLMLKLEKDYSNFFELNYNSPTLSISDLKSKLSENELLIEYYEGEEALYTFVIGNRHRKFLKLPKVKPEKIIQFTNGLMPEYFSVNQSKSFKDFIQESHSFYNHLILPCLPENKENVFDKLYVIPDKSLNYLPFELLVEKEDFEKELDYSKISYLINKFSLSYGYSSSVLFHTSGSEKQTGTSVLAFAPSYKKTTQSENSIRGDLFNELVFNKEEVSEIGEFFKSEIIIDSAANEKQFREKAKDFDILHLAMHAIVDNENSGYSKLAFASSNEEGQDNFLHSFELYNMQIPNRLTVLSACNTGSGNLAGGEGIMSLARAFTYAGSESVVMSHWQIDDASSKKIMKYFYQYLSEGKSKSEALRAAKLSYLKTANPNKQHPFFWAAFVMIGNDMPLVSTSNKYSYWIAGMLILILLSLLLRVTL